MQLTEISDQFEAMGINVVAITYDAVELLKDVQLDQDIGFPLLSDVNRQHVDAFGVLNTDYAPDSRAYGVPYPGIFLISPDGVIRHKFAEERYQDRPDFAHVLEAAASM